MGNIRRFLVNSPSLLELIPDFILNKCQKSDFVVGAELEELQWRFSTRSNQMLGYSEASTACPEPVDSEDMLLLQLQSGSGAGFRFGDVGDVEFKLIRKI